MAIEFPLFSSLAPELRCQIWRDALPEPTGPTLYFYRNRGCWRPRQLTEADHGYIAGNGELNVGFDFRTDLLGDDNQFQVPLVLVNREARDIALTWLQEQGIKTRPQKQGECLFARPFNPSLDVLYVTDEKWEDFCFEAADRLFEPDLHGRSVDLQSDLMRIAIPEALFYQTDLMSWLPDVERWFEHLRVLFVVMGSQPNDTFGPWRWELQGVEAGAFLWNKEKEEFEYEPGSGVLGDEALLKKIGEAARNGLRDELITCGLKSLEIRPVFTNYRSPTMASQNAQCDQFAVLPIRMPPLPSFPHSAVHEVRIRQNTPKIPTENDSRSLFMKNIPADSTEPHFRAVFTSLVGAGRFETIFFDDEEGKRVLPVDPAQATNMRTIARKRKMMDVEAEEREREEQATRLPRIWTRQLHRSSGTAVVLLADEKSVHLVLKAIAKAQKSKKYPVWGENLADQVPDLGSSWISTHLQLSRVDKSATQAAVHAFFNAFNRKEKAAVELAKRLRNEPDEDGFVTVTRGGRAAPASRNEAEEAKQRMIDKAAKKKSELSNFYRFQLREQRKKEQARLLRRFQEEKRKVNAMRERHGKFKPET
ncbi:hypothetical protein NOR_04624 [Metarhizium rileyi]|uniref:Ribosomal RNA-processing protein 7 n=1 Tax=Metarhizium rileyi (strain RCEF 4871) TaxID=1649241 RepID=A0A167E3Y2_METRR|nr:hypothetical protein NOR_04624 [Metarhizium rileyi RCEF 4871]